MTAADIVKLALAGDTTAIQVMEEAGRALGAAVATLAMVLDVDLFVVGGGVVKAGDLLLEPARRAVPKIVVAPSRVLCGFCKGGW